MFSARVFSAPTRSFLIGFVLVSLVSCLVPAFAVEGVKVLALFPNKAMLSIDGKRRVLASGETSREGVKLISADPRSALVEFNGERRELRLGSGVAARYQRPASTEVRIPKALNGSYRTTGWVNGRPVDFLVDTGASGVAMSQVEADRLGIRYRMDGEPITVATASGTERGYQVDLNSVRVGEIELNRVQGIVVRGNSPQDILLGMSFLGRLDVRHSGDLMVLRKKY